MTNKIISQINSNPAISTTAKKVFSFIVEAYHENLKKSRGNGRKDCITILKYVLKKAYEMAGFFPSPPIIGEKITDDIKAMKNHGFCNQVNFYYPITFKKNITTGILPQKPRIFQTLRFDDFARSGTVAESRPFITAKILSIMDGYHAVLILGINYNQVIFLDNNEILCFENLGTIPNAVFPTDKLNAKLNQYVSERWCKIQRDTGTRFKTETILATLNLFDWLV